MNCITLTLRKEGFPKFFARRIWERDKQNPAQLLPARRQRREVTLLNPFEAGHVAAYVGGEVIN